MKASLLDKIANREAGICLYGLAPPKQSSPPDQIETIAAHQAARLRGLDLDGVVVYDIQDEAERSEAPRPFPFLPTLDPELYAHHFLAEVTAPKIVYRCVSRDDRESFGRWLASGAPERRPRFSVLVGAPSRGSRVTLALKDAYALARPQPSLLLGGIAIAERHARRGDEHERILAKTSEGCRFFVTQAVYDVTSTKSMLSDYALAVGKAAVPIIVTFAPCGSEKTLAFMKWLGISFPRWLENELRFASDPLATSLKLCDQVFAEVWEYARSKQIPLGINVESVSIRKAEIEASVELMRLLQSRMQRG